jgi:ligand-binding sensor domain-containing protein
MKLLHLSLPVLCFAACLCAKAQQPELSFKRITSKDGLSGDVVYCVLEDKQGFLWIGTHRGLNRFDGYRFRYYMYDPEDTNSISGNHVHCIKEDGDAVLWISTNKGLNSLDPVTGGVY